MSLDPMPSPAELRRMHAERIARTPRGQPLRGPLVQQTPAPDQVVIVLPWSVLASQSSKGLYSAVGAKGYLARLAQARQLAHDQYGAAAPMAGGVGLYVRLYVPDRRKRDGMNYLKLLGDALTGNVLADDSQCLVGGWRVMLDVDRPRAECTITRDPTLTLGTEAP